MTRFVLAGGTATSLSTCERSASLTSDSQGAASPAISNLYVRSSGPPLIRPTVPKYSRPRSV
jgi:hypothetical protein